MQGTLMPRPSPAAFAVPGDLSSPTGGYRYDSRLLAALRDTGRDVAHIRLPDGFPHPSDAQMAEACDLLAQVSADRVLIVDGLAFGALPTDALTRIDAPIVALVHHPLAHESGLPTPEAERLRALETANLARSAHILVPSPHIKDVLLADYAIDAHHITVIRPGRPDLSPQGLPTPVPPDPHAPPLILSVGLLHPRKGHDILIDALAQITDLPWRAVIVGAPWAPGHAETLTRQINGADLAGRVHLAGRIDRASLDRHYHEAYVFALATRYEGYGIVFDEALIHGLPIVSTTADAVPGTVPQDAGTLVAPEDASAFATALRHLLRDKTRHAAQSAAARQAAAALPGWPDAAGHVGAILDRIAGRTT